MTFSTGLVVPRRSGGLAIETGEPQFRSELVANDGDGELEGHEQGGQESNLGVLDRFSGNARAAPAVSRLAREKAPIMKRGIHSMSQAKMRNPRPKSPLPAPIKRSNSSATRSVSSCGGATTRPCSSSSLSMASATAAI